MNFNAAPYKLRMLRDVTGECLMMKINCQQTLKIDVRKNRFELTKLGWLKIKKKLK